jgi:hypothetical protein
LLVAFQYPLFIITHRFDYIISILKLPEKALSLQPEILKK